MEHLTTERVIKYGTIRLSWRMAHVEFLKKLYITWQKEKDDAMVDWGIQTKFDEASHGIAQWLKVWFLSNHTLEKNVS